MARDPYSKNVVLLLRCNGAHNGTSFPDSSLKGRTLYRYGNTKTVTDQKIEGTASARFDGNGDYFFRSDATLSTHFRPFTLEGWFRCDDLNQQHGLWSQGSYNLLINANGSLRWIYTDHGNLITADTDPAIIQPLTWHHVALCAPTITQHNNLWTGGTYRLYLDGQPHLNISYSNPGNFYGSATYIARALQNATPRYLKGHMDLLRLTTGLNRYPEPFTPPTDLDDCIAMGPTTQLITSL